MPAASPYELLPGLLLGFHGTDEATVESVLSGKCHLNHSQNDYDWLGHGVYFWEYSPQRAYDFAKQSLKDKKITRGKIKKPAVIGAVIDPRYCLNMLEASALEQALSAYEMLDVGYDLTGSPLPKNKGGEDLRARFLDCAVIEMLHQIREYADRRARGNGGRPVPPYDTVRGAFWEGKDLYPNAGFKEKNHVQICVRNLDCIKGYFRPLPGSFKR